MTMPPLLKEARPKQWAKNVLVFAAPGAAGVLNEWDSLWPTLLSFVALSLTASGTYFWNDILDVEADRVPAGVRDVVQVVRAQPLEGATAVLDDPVDHQCVHSGGGGHGSGISHRRLDPRAAVGS